MLNGLAEKTVIWMDARNTQEQAALIPIQVYREMYSRLTTAERERYLCHTADQLISQIKNYECNQGHTDADPTARAIEYAKMMTTAERLRKVQLHLGITIQY